MSVSALLKSFSRVTREKSRRKSVTLTALMVEIVEDRCLLSVVDIFPPIPSGGPGSGPAGKLNPLTAIPKLNSNPGAPVTIYLDFDGHTETQDWPSARTDGNSGAIVTPVFDVDNDLSTFSDEELRMMEEVWYRVSEDYSPFNVNVTTIDPGSYNDFQAVLVSIGGNGSWIGSPGGVAFLYSFSGGAVNTCYVFTDNTGRGGADHMKGTALAVSHEVGHMLGLNHHSVYDANGNLTAQYDGGRPDLGPIMGAPYGSERETWSLAPDNNGPNSIQDDLAIITGTTNRVIQFRPDDHGNTIQTATQIVVTSPNIAARGIIEQNNDVDMFRFETDSGNISLSVEGLNLRSVYGLTNVNYGTNLDLELRLYNAAGTLLMTAAPSTSLFASLTANVAQGVYYAAVSGTGQYGAIGQYSLTGTVIPLPSVPTMISPSGVVPNPIPTFQWTVGANAASYELEVDNLTAGRARYYTTTVATTSHTAPAQFPEGDYRARVRTIGNNGTTSNWSSYLTFTIDVPTPVPPVITRPQGDVANSFPTFEWTASPGAANYTLWVTRLDNQERVIYRTNYSGTNYTHFDPLPNATYRAWVRAFNTVGEFSAWSNFVDFRVVAPVPVAPTLTAPARVTNSTNPRFVWTPVEGAARYDLWVNNLSTGKSQYVRKEDIARTSTFYDPPAMDQGSYIAWIRAANGNNEYSPWSVGYTFTVDILPPATTKLTGPLGTNGSKIVETVNPTFTWDAAPRAVRYDLWVNNITTGKAQIIRRDDIKTTSFTSTTNLPQGEYRAWVRGINSADEVGEWSAPFNFTLDEPTPVVPQVIAPTANLAGVVETANPTFVWTSATKSPLYELEVNNVSLNQAKVISVKGISEEKYTVPSNQRLGEYIFSARVRAYNNSGEVSDWSQPFRFRIDIPDPTTPVIIGPTGTSKNTTPQFSWVHTATSYRYEILVTDLVRNETVVLNVTVFQLNPQGTQAFYNLPSSMALKPSTYRFWIRSFNALGQASSWSTSQTFVISAQLDPNLLESKPVGGELLLTSLLKPALGNAPANPASVAQNTEAMFSERMLPQDISQTSLNDLPVELSEPPQDVAMIDVAMGMMADPASRFASDDALLGRVRS
jgi:hypothetical protein